MSWHTDAGLWPSPPAGSIARPSVPDRGAARVLGAGPPITVLRVSPPDGAAVATSTTSSAGAAFVWPEPFIRPADGTAGGAGALVSASADAEVEALRIRSEASAREATRRAVSELRLLSGLTWELLAGIFGVSARSVHFWISGKPLSADHERRVLGVLDVIRLADRGSARANRTALFEASGGVTAYALLTAGDLASARAQLGQGEGRRVINHVPMSAEARRALAPLPPEMLVGALHDPIHQAPRRARGARTLRNSGREPR